MSEREYTVVLTYQDMKIVRDALGKANDDEIRGSFRLYDKFDRLCQNADLLAPADAIVLNDTSDGADA